MNQLMTSFSNGLTAGFGEVIAKNEEETLKKSYSSYEYMYFVIMFIVIACMGVLILPFVGVYTINLTDVQYVRPVLGILFTLIVFMQNVRIPGLTIICAAGHYKETRYQAILEAVINIKCTCRCTSLYCWNICYSSEYSIFCYMAPLCDRNGGCKRIYYCWGKLCG